MPGNLKKRSRKNSIIKKAMRAAVGVLSEFLFHNMTEEDARAKEIELISKYGRRDIGIGILANHTDGGEGTSGHVKSPEAVERMRKANTGKTLSEDHKKKIGAALKGTKHGEEMKKRVSAARTGARHSDESKAKMSESRIGKRHSSITIERMQFSRWDKNPIWLSADKVYDKWLELGMPGPKKFNAMIPGTRELSRKFAKAWVPSNDPTWKKYRDSK